MMNNASRAARILSKLGASKGGIALAASLTPSQRRERARAAVAARWNSTNQGRLTQDQQRVMKRLEGLESVTLSISGGPSGKRRRAAIEQLVAAGKIRVLADSAVALTVSR